MTYRAPLLFAFVALLFVLEATSTVWVFSGSLNTSLGILNMALVSAIMALGVNLQWGFAGLFNVGVMGFVALGGLAAVLVAMPPVGEAWAAGGGRLLLGLVCGAATIVAAVLVQMRMPAGRARGWVTLAVILGGFILYRTVFDPAKLAVEAVNPAGTVIAGKPLLPRKRQTPSPARPLISGPRGEPSLTGGMLLVG